MFIQLAEVLKYVGIKLVLDNFYALLKQMILSPTHA